MKHAATQINPQVYAYRGYTIDGYENHITAWKVYDTDEEWIESYATLREAKNAINGWQT